MMQTMILLIGVIYGTVAHRDVVMRIAMHLTNDINYLRQMHAEGMKELAKFDEVDPCF